MVRVAIAAVVVLWAGCAFDPSGLAQRGAGGDGGGLADQVLEGGQLADAGDSHVDPPPPDAQLADQVLVDAPPADAGAKPYLASCSSGECGAPNTCASDNVTPRDLPPHKVCTHQCSSDAECPAPSAGCTSVDPTTPGYCRGPRIAFFEHCEQLPAAGGFCPPDTPPGFGCNWCVRSNGGGCYAVGPGLTEVCAKPCQRQTDCPAQWICSTNLCRYSP